MNYYEGANILSDNRAIGVFDSGIGGITVAKEIMKLLPRESIVYFGDTGRVPYGTKSSETIKKYALQDERFLLKNNVKLIVAACGTVSSVAYDTAKQLPVPFIEVVSHSVKAAVKATKNKKIGILATNATIKSGAHKKQILSALPGAEVVETAASLLVPIVEEGWTDKDNIVAREAVKTYLAPMIERGVDTVILGCTHFPVLWDMISEALGKNVTLINMGTATAQAVKDLLYSTNALCCGDNIPKHRFYVSDETEAFAETAQKLIGCKLDKELIEQVDIESE